MTRHRSLTFLLSVTAWLTASSGVLLAQAPEGREPLPEAWKAPLSEYLDGVRTSYTLMGVPRPDAAVQGLQGVYEPVIRRFDADGGRLAQLGHGRFKTQFLDTSDPAGKHGLLDRMGIGLRSGQGWVPTDDAPSQRVLERFRAGLAGSEIDYTRAGHPLPARVFNPFNGNPFAVPEELRNTPDFGSFTSQVHGVLAPAVVRTMGEVPAATDYSKGTDGRYGAGDLRSMSDWHRFFNQADQGYLPAATNTHGVELTAEQRKLLEDARRRSGTLGSVLSDPTYGIWNPKTGEYQPLRLETPVEEQPAPRADVPAGRVEQEVPATQVRAEAEQPAGPVGVFGF